MRVNQFTPKKGRAKKQFCRSYGDGNKTACIVCYIEKNRRYGMSRIER